MAVALLSPRQELRFCASLVAAVPLISCRLVGLPCFFLTWRQYNALHDAFIVWHRADCSRAHCLSVCLCAGAGPSAEERARGPGVLGMAPCSILPVHLCRPVYFYGTGGRKEKWTLMYAVMHTREAHEAVRILELECESRGCLCGLDTVSTHARHGLAQCWYVGLTGKGGLWLFAPHFHGCLYVYT